MGMFDYVVCDHPLPDGAPDGPFKFQTKSMDFMGLGTYTIHEDGTLTGPLNQAMPDYRGEIRFYDNNPRDGWVEFSALFDRGRLIGIRLISPEDTP